MHLQKWKGLPEPHVILKRFLGLYRVIGCCFIRGLFAEDCGKLRPARTPPYVVYSSAILGLAWYSFVNAILRNLDAGTMKHDLLVMISVYYVVHTHVSFYSMVVHAPRLVRVVKTCASFDSRRPLQRRSKRHLSRFYATVTAYFLSEGVVKIMLGFRSLADYSGVEEFFWKLGYAVGVAFLLFWCSLPQEAVLFMSRWLVIHIRHMRTILVLTGKLANAHAKYVFRNTRDGVGGGLRLGQMRGVSELTHVA